MGIMFDVYKGCMLAKAGRAIVRINGVSMHQAGSAYWRCQPVHVGGDILYSTAASSTWMIRQAACVRRDLPG
jgi:hypothetical protein